MAMASPATSPIRRKASRAAASSPGDFPTRDRRDLARLRRGVRCDAGLARVDASDGADADPVLGREIAVELVPDEPDLPGRAVVADEELAVPHDAGAEAGTERDAEEVAVAPGAPRLREQPVDFGKQAVERLAVGEEIAVVVDEDRHAEPVFEHRAERDPASKAREGCRDRRSLPPRSPRDPGRQRR